ncbi:DUF2267 domain-containing protein [Mycobacterium sp. 4D054]|uniref:DUF2267 domain-containing protein n=1 Tax=Mycobacterium sp. 4D054 TaxID=3457440 RepID=UPI003FD354E8
MENDRFFSIIEREAGVDRETAQTVARSTLVTLAQRVTPGALHKVQVQAPEGVRTWLSPKAPRELFDADEFVARVAQQTGTDADTARRYAHAALLALSRAVSADAWETLIRELPADFAPLLAGTRRSAVPMPVDEFLQWVADRGGFDRETAARATEAVLETLAERIAGGEVDDLTKELPPEFRPVLERGKKLGGGRAHKMPLEEFVHRIAEREGVPDDIARAHARAVLNTVRDAVVAKEWHDLSSELPRSYLQDLAEP